MTQARRRTVGSAVPQSLKALYLNADYDEFMLVARQTTKFSDEDALLYARVLLKRHEPQRALDFLKRLRVGSAGRTALEYRLMTAIAVARLHGSAGQKSGRGSSKDIDATFSQLASDARGLSDVKSEVAYWWARALIDRDDFEHALEVMPDILQSGSEEQTVRSLHIRSTLAERQERYKDEADALIATLQYIQSARRPHVEIRAHATETLAALAREMYIPKARPLVERSLQQSWPSFFARQRFQALKALGWICALDGDIFNAFRNLKEATRCVNLLEPHKRAAWRTMALLDRAYLAWSIGEHSWARQELAEAEESERDVDWAATGDERVALLLLAEMFVHFDIGRSAKYLRTYQELPAMHDPLVNFNFGSRLRAIADYAAGVVYVGVGQKAQGQKCLRNALATFDPIGYDWRAGRSALRLFESTGDAKMLRLAEEKLRNYSASWLGAELRSKGRPAPSMTPAQTTVFKLMLAGKSTDDIAAEMGRSKFTVRNHVKQILKVFGVNSRPALLVEAARRNLR